MALFGKKKLTLEEIIRGIEELSPEDKAVLKEKVTKEEAKETIETPEEVTEKEDEKVEAEETPEKETTAETVKTEEETITPEVPEEPKQAEAEETPEVETTEDEPVVDEPVINEQEKDNSAEIIKALTDRVNNLENALEGLTELKEKMEEFTRKQADNFGYRSKYASDEKKSWDEMSAEEFEEKMQRGEI